VFVLISKRWELKTTLSLGEERVPRIYVYCSTNVLFPPASAIILAIAHWKSNAILVLATYVKYVATFDRVSIGPPCCNE
jgi:hypothetical protein